MHGCAGNQRWLAGVRAAGTCLGRGGGGTTPPPQVRHRGRTVGASSRRPTRWHPPPGGISCPAHPRRARCPSGLTCSATWQAASRTVQALRRATLRWPRRPGMQSRMGCDSQVRLPDGRYALLQFKRPPPGGGGMSIKAPSRQASALLKTCPASSFPVLPAVGTNGVSGESGPACPAAPSPSTRGSACRLRPVRRKAAAGGGGAHRPPAPALRRSAVCRPGPSSDPNACPRHGVTAGMVDMGRVGICAGNEV